jgi:hypothetical protein
LDVVNAPNPSKVNGWWWRVDAVVPIDRSCHLGAGAPATSAASRPPRGKRREDERVARIARKLVEKCLRVEGREPRRFAAGDGVRVGDVTTRYGWLQSAMR